MGVEDAVNAPVIQGEIVPVPVHPAVLDGRLPKGMAPWVKGQSGNPSGKPKGVACRRAIRKFFLETVNVSVKDRDYRGERLTVVLQALYDRAMELIPKAPSLGDLMMILPLLNFAKAVIDGDSVKAMRQAVKETHEEQSTVYVSDGTRKTHTILATQTVEPQDDGENGNEEENDE